MVKVTKIKLHVKSEAEDKEEINRVYSYLRDMQYIQYRMLNSISGALYSNFYNCGMDLKSEEFMKIKKEITLADYPIYETLNVRSLCGAPDLRSACCRKVLSDFSTAVKNGLCSGERSAPNYKLTFPISVRGRDIKLFTPYNSDDELVEASKSQNFEVYFKWINKCVFRMDTGSTFKNSSRILRQNLVNLILHPEEYKIAQSGIAVKGKEIILTLSIDFPEKKAAIKDNMRMGVTLGVNSPVIASVYDTSTGALPQLYPIGNTMEIEDVRIRIHAQRAQKQDECRYTRSGNGRRKKMRHYYGAHLNEKNAVKTLNHKLSKSIVQLAVEKNCSVIVLHELSDMNFSTLSDVSILRNWNYFELYNFITYKAKEYGIEVKYSREAHLFDKCCKCGNEKDMNVLMDHFGVTLEERKNKKIDLTYFYTQLKNHENEKYRCENCGCKDYLYAENYGINLVTSNDIEKKKTKRAKKKEEKAQKQQKENSEIV